VCKLHRLINEEKSHVLEHRVVTADRRSLFGVHFAGLANVSESIHGRKHTSSEPYSVGLY